MALTHKHMCWMWNQYVRGTISLRRCIRIHTTCSTSRVRERRLLGNTYLTNDFDVLSAAGSDERVYRPEDVLDVVRGPDLDDEIRLA